MKNSILDFNFWPKKIKKQNNQKSFFDEVFHFFSPSQVLFGGKESYKLLDSKILLCVLFSADCFTSLCCSTFRHCCACDSKLLHTHGILWI